MNLAIYTSDLTVANAYLMPWRVVLEVAASCAKAGHRSLVLSGVARDLNEEWTACGVRIREVRKPSAGCALGDLEPVCQEERIEVLYWPLDWRRARTDVLDLEKTGLRVVWYIPGAWYALRRVLRAAWCMHSKDVLPYLVQALYPKRRFVRILTAAGVRPLITMTEYTRDRMIEAGYPTGAVKAVPPGKPPLPATGASPVLFSQWEKRLQGAPYFLFFGPPQAIRGVGQMFSAFQQVARRHATVHLVCLFRADAGLDATQWKRRIERLDCGDRVFCAWESVGAADLTAFLTHCYAVLKPFLLVPSEIPLAVIETAAYGKPVIGTGPDGTGEFVERFGMTVPAGRADRLAGAMLALLGSKKTYSDKCQAARRVYASHPTWDEVARQWLEVANVA